MKPAAPEFSRPFNVSHLPKTGAHAFIVASPDECRQLAKRLDLPRLYAVSARLYVKPWRGGGVRLTGDMQVDLEQLSVISMEPFRTQQQIDIERFFMAMPPQPRDADEELIDPIVNGFIDLGEILAETLALELDPYPRKPGEIFKAAGG